MKTIGLGTTIAALTIALFASLPADAQPHGFLAARVMDITVDADGGRSNVMLSRGARQHVLPGAHGHLVGANGHAISGSDFVVEKVTATSSHASVPLGVQAVNASSQAFVQSSTCHLGPDAPRFGTRDTAEGKVAPEGYTFVEILDITVNEDGLNLILQRGTDGGILPGSHAYVVTPGSGTPLAQVEIKNATAHRAYALVPGVKRPFPNMGKVGVQHAHCTRQ